MFSSEKPSDIISALKSYFEIKGSDPEVDDKEYKVFTFHVTPYRLARTMPLMISRSVLVLKVYRKAFAV